MEPTAAHPTSRRRLRRRWRVPPAIMHASDEQLESAGVLNENEGAVALVLWQSLRDVTLWASAAPSERDGLFTAAAERNRIAAILTATLDPEVEPPLGMITAMVGRPGRVSAERVALACRRIAQWADTNGKLATALAFAQAGAVTCPGDASAAFKVGQIARRRAEYVRSETWFRRAIALARQEGDWTSYALAFSGLGNLYIQRGNLPKARALHMRALRAAMRHSLKSVQGDALHDLFVVTATSGDVEVAQQFAGRAFETYGPLHPRLPVLAQDVAFFWLLRGYFAPALQVFQSLRPLAGASIPWILLVPNLARAAGGAGQHVLFDQAWKEVWAVVGGEAPEAGHAEALLEIGRGAASLCQWERAATAARRAIEVARSRSEHRIEFEADALLEAVSREQAAADHGRLGTDAPLGLPEGRQQAGVVGWVPANEVPSVVESLAGAFAQTLEEYAAAR